MPLPLQHDPHPSSELALCVCLDKSVAKCIVRSAGVATPDYAVVRDFQDLERVAMRYPAFAKPLAEGTGKGVSAASRVENETQLREVCEQLLCRFRQPVLIEEYLPGREFTVGIVGTGEHAEPLGTMEILLLPQADPGAYSYLNKENWKHVVEYRYLQPTDDPLIADVHDCALRAWRALGCRDGGRVDIRCNQEGRPEFIEANPLAGLHPDHSDLPLLCTAFKLSFRYLIARILESAMQRVPSTLARADSSHAHHCPA